MFSGLSTDNLKVLTSKTEKSLFSFLTLLSLSGGNEKLIQIEAKLWNQNYQEWNSYQLTYENITWLDQHSPECVSQTLVSQSQYQVIRNWREKKRRKKKINILSSNRLWKCWIKKKHRYLVSWKCRYKRDLRSRLIPFFIDEEYSPTGEKQVIQDCTATNTTQYFDTQ